MNVKQTLAVAVFTLAAAGTAFAGDSTNDRGAVSLSRDSSGALVASITLHPSLSTGTFDDFYYLNAQEMRSISVDTHNLGGITWDTSSISDAQLHSSTFSTSSDGNDQHGALSGGNTGIFTLHLSGHVNSGQGDYSMQVTAVPEPETVAMLLAGLGVVGWASRRRAARVTLTA